MAASQERALTHQDLDKAVRAVAGLLKSDEIVVIGSQALLVHREDIDRDLRGSVEFDMYAMNAAAWEAENAGLEASEQIAAILGEASPFHHRHGFFVDGVDEKTASLPHDWRKRQIVREVDRPDGSTIRVIAPCPADIVASKLQRGDPKDQEFASRCLRLGLATYAQILQSIRKIDGPPERLEMSERLLRAASRRKNEYVAAKGPRPQDSVELMLENLKRAARSKDD